MNHQSLKILLVEDHPADAYLLQEILYESDRLDWTFIHVESLRAACQALEPGDIDLVLLDLSLPDAQGLEAIVQIQREFPETAIVVLTGLSSEEIGLEAVRLGAQDYLSKGSIDRALLVRTIRYAVERSVNQQVMRQQTAAIAASRDGIAILNRRWEYTYLNQAHCEIYGYSNPNELLNQTWCSLYELDECQRIEREISTVLEQQGHWHGEAIGQRRDGELFYQELSLTCFESGYICIVRDISDRKLAERSLRVTQFALDRVSDSVYLVEDNDRFSYVNQAACQTLGYSQAELLNLTIQDITPWDSSEDWLTWRQQLKQSGAKIFETVKHTKSGQQLPVEVSANYLNFDGHDFVCAIVRDISKRKLAEAEILRMLEQEKELSDLKSRFISTASHEFRTPLTTILSASELLQHNQHRLAPEKQERYYQQIKTAVRHIIQLLDELLLISQQKTDELILQPRSLNLLEFCQTLIEGIQMNTNNSHPIAFTHADDRELINLFVDEKLLRHILSNLLSNAIKYSPAGQTVQLNLALGGLPTEGSSAPDCPSHIVFEVRDQGYGIPEEDLPRLFEPFHRARNAGLTPGTGLGLSIVKNAVVLYKGEINVESQVGVGTLFTVKLPLQSHLRSLTEQSMTHPLSSPHLHSKI